MDPNANIQEQIIELRAAIAAKRGGRAAIEHVRRVNELRADYSRWTFTGGFPASDESLSVRDKLADALRAII